MTLESSLATRPPVAPSIESPFKDSSTPRSEADPFCVDSLERSVARGPVSSRIQRSCTYLHTGPECQARCRSAETGVIVCEAIALRERGFEQAAADLELFFQISPDMLCVLSLDGLFERANPAFRKLSGYSTEELLSMRYMQLVHADDVPLAELHLRLIAQGAITDGLELRLRAKDGLYRWTEWNGMLLEDGTKFYAAGRDITDKKRMAVAMRAAKEAAEAANVLKSQFLANMSHELRTPMNGILGMAELALQSNPASEQREHLRDIYSSAQSLLSVLNGILDFSGFEARRLTLVAADFNLHEVADSVMRLASVESIAKGIALQCDIASDVPEWVTGDAARVRQILGNLVGNAVKFTASGEVGLKIVRVAGRQGCASLHLTVSDTGIGVPADRREDIFHPFVQVDGSLSRRYGGTGLGLAICAELVKNMAGRIWVADRGAEPGSSFHVRIDLALPAPPTSEVQPADLEALRDLRVLVADGSPSNLQTLKRFLEEWGMEPVLANSGEIAIRELRRQQDLGRPFSLVVADACMLGKDGLPLAESMRRLAFTACPPILLLRPAGCIDETASGQNRASQACVLKPVSRRRLLDAILANLQAAPGTLDTPAPLSRVAGSGLRVLVAEDDEVNQHVITAMLKHRGNHVLLVQNGAEAVVRTLNQSFDLILMDIQMPEMDGYKATQAIRSRERRTGRHTPIVALTAHAMKGDKDRCLAAGMDGYVSKPIRLDDLDAMLRQFNGSRVQ
jgi:two-component system, sensor histidine kinase and response regulator